MICVLKPGILTTVQDLGRYGYQKYGIVVSGAMDIYSMKLSNILVGNNEKEGVFEITLKGPELEIQKGNLIAITGADISPEINGISVPMNRPVYLREDCILKFGECKNGCRSYIAFAGGFDIEPVMGSKSTYLRGKLGGIDGRALKKYDKIELGEKNFISKSIIQKLEEYKKSDTFVYPDWYINNYNIKKSDTQIIRFIEERQYVDLSEESKKRFLNSEFTIDSKSDRMGYRLKGPEIKLKSQIEIISGEVSFGTVQLPLDGNPIILLADRATAGGYPKIAHIAACDIQKLVQMKPSEKIKFKKITFSEAEELYLKRENYIKDIQKSIILMSM